MYIRPDKAIRENIIVKMEEDRDAVQTAFGSDHIEHDIDFADHAAPVGAQSRPKVALCGLTPHIGGAVAMGILGGIPVVDILVNAISILVAPMSLALPGSPVFANFKPGTVIPPGTVIEYTVNDMGATFEGLSVNVEWIKDLNDPWIVI